MNERLIRIASAVYASAQRGRRHKKPTAKGKQRYRKMKQKGGSSLIREKRVYMQKWRKGKGRSAPSTRKV